MPASMAVRDLHLADLHQRARELRVPRYRMLTRDELIEAIEKEGGPEEAPREVAPEGDAPKEVASPAAAAETEDLSEETSTSRRRRSAAASSVPVIR
jgi:hypothetical protein